MQKITIDYIDLKIIEILYNLKAKQSITTTSLARKIFDIPNNRELIRKDCFIRNRLKKLSQYSLIDIVRDNNTDDYCLNTENCYHKKITIINPRIDQNFFILRINGDWVMLS